MGVLLVGNWPRVSAKGAFSMGVRHRTDSPWRTWGIAPGNWNHTGMKRWKRDSAVYWIALSALTYCCFMYLGRCPRLTVILRLWRLR